MQKEISNYGRFWTAFNSLRIPGDAEDYKRMFVSQFTNGTHGKSARDDTGRV